MRNLRTVIGDEKESHARTSIRMTRSMTEDIGFKVKKIFKEIIERKVELSYDEWIWFISMCWSDPVWINALVIVINRCRAENFNLNKCSYFLDFILEKTPGELKETVSKIHPIARLSLMELVDKKPSKPEKPHKYKDVWE